MSKTQSLAFASATDQPQFPRFMRANGDTLLSYLNQTRTDIHVNSKMSNRATWRYKHHRSVVCRVRWDPWGGWQTASLDCECSSSDLHLNNGFSKSVLGSMVIVWKCRRVRMIERLWNTSWKKVFVYCLISGKGLNQVISWLMLIVCYLTVSSMQGNLTEHLKYRPASPRAFQMQTLKFNMRYRFTC